MATINDKQMIDNLIANNGYYPGDPRVAKIVEYANAFGDITWGITWVSNSKFEQDKYLIESYYVRNPKLIWEAK